LFVADGLIVLNLLSFVIQSLLFFFFFKR